MSESENYPLTTDNYSSHPHNIVTRVDVHYFAGDRAAPVAAEIERGLADFFGVDIAFERRALGDMVQHGFEIGNSRRCEGPQRSGGNRIHADAFRSQVVGEVAYTR